MASIYPRSAPATLCPISIVTVQAHELGVIRRRQNYRKPKHNDVRMRCNNDSKNCPTYKSFFIEFPPTTSATFDEERLYAFPCIRSCSVKENINRNWYRVAKGYDTNEVSGWYKRNWRKLLNSSCEAIRVWIREVFNMIFSALRVSWFVSVIPWSISKLKWKHISSKARSKKAKRIC